MTKPMTIPAQVKPATYDVEEAVKKVIFEPNEGPQTEFLAASEQEVLYGGSAGGGKVLSDEGVILTPFGWKKGKDLKVGDLVCHPFGGVQKIVLLHPRNTYEKWTVHFKDGTKTEVAEEHLWESWKSSRVSKKVGKRVFGKESSEVVTTKTLKSWIESGYTPQIPVTFPVCSNITTREKDKLDPYVLGVLLGDGCITTSNIAVSCHPDDKDHFREYFTGSVTWSDKMCFRPIGDYRKYIVEKLKLYNLLGTNSYSKFIPDKYLYAGEETRLAILQGLMDTDGWSAKDKNAVYYDTVSPQLSKGMCHLVRSLGGTVSVRESIGKYYDQECQNVYHLYIRLPDPDSAFRMKRKQFGSFGRNLVQKIVDRVEVGGELVGRCITVSHPDGLYITNDFIVTHNSYAMLADPLRDMNNPNFRGILFRRTNDELRELKSKSKELYPLAIPDMKWHERDNQWTAPSGATFWMTYLERDDDVLRYQGQAFNWIGFDEITQYPSPHPWDYMRSRLRAAKNSGLKLYSRATTNPGGPGHGWVKKMFIDPAPAGKSFWATNIENGQPLVYPKGHAREGQYLFKRRFIPARLEDNPYLYEDGNYEANLLSLPEHQRKQLRDGNWDIAEGAAFVEFNRDVHVIEPFKIPAHWARFRACDYGYGSKSGVLWFAVGEYGELYVYRELVTTKVTAVDLAYMVLDMEKQEKVRYGVLDSSLWHNRGDQGPSLAEQMIAAGCRWRPYPRSKGSRVAGKNEIHRRLQSESAPGFPSLRIFNTCVNLISELPILPLDKTNPEDIDTRSNDHLYDALRYGIMSRPRSHLWDYNPTDTANQFTPADSTFGY